MCYLFAASKYGKNRSRSEFTQIMTSVVGAVKNETSIPAHLLNSINH